LIPRKPVERLFALLPLLVVPVIVLPILVFAWQQAAPKEFESRATIWVTESQVAGIPEFGAEALYVSPSQRQSDVIAQLLRTDAFALEVARDAGFLGGGTSTAAPADAIATPLAPGQATAVNWVRTHAYARSEGGNLLAVIGMGPTPEDAQSLAAATVLRYLDEVEIESQRKSQLSVEFYQSRLAEAEAELAVLDQQVRDYLARTPSASAFGFYDPAFERMRGQFDAQRGLVGELERSLQLVQLDATSAEQARQSRYVVVDPASLPKFPIGKRLMVRAGYPLAGAAVGGGIALVMLYVATLLDRTVRSTEDLAAFTQPVLAVLPDFQGRRPWYLRIARRDTTYARRLALSLAGRPSLSDRN
jgi:hypothetical protein